MKLRIVSVDDLLPVFQRIFEIAQIVNIALGRDIGVVNQDVEVEFVFLEDRQVFRLETRMAPGQLKKLQATLEAQPLDMHALSY